MNPGQWFDRPLGLSPTAILRDWLVEPGSLTRRCCRACLDFRVRLLDYGDGRALDCHASPVRVRIREVVLECDGRPVIFAHTSLTGGRGRLGRWLARLGERSLGSLLFSCPGFRRGPIEFRRIDARHPLYRRAARLGAVGKTLWARRSWHRLGGQRVLVVEVFLPAITEL